MDNGDLLLLAVADVTVDGQRLEGVGVRPTIEVPFDPVFGREGPAAEPCGGGALREDQGTLKLEHTKPICHLKSSCVLIQRNEQAISARYGLAAAAFLSSMRDADG
jgi:hypothetical protein